MKARAFPFLALGALLLIGGALVYAARGRPQAAPLEITEAASPDELTVESCGLLVSFGSYAMGIDQDLFARISAYVVMAPGVEAASLARWGREGERTLCVKAAPAELDRIYDAIKAMIPVEQPRAPTTLERKDQPSFPPRS